jgi:outer membrane lipoprotein-sorting protein
MTGIEERRRPWRFLSDSVSVKRRAVLAACFGFAAARLSGVAVAAAPPPAVALTSQDNADLQRIAAYLGSIRTMYAKFRQVASGGGIATGQLWMARPGRMRFEYDPPSPILLLADTFYVYYVDKELIQMSKVGLKSTPAWLLLRDPITFNDLRQWSIVDQQRKTTTVSLYDERFGVALDPKLFVYQDPYAASRRQNEP